MQINNTLAIDAFWISNKFFPSEQIPSSRTGEIFRANYPGNAYHLGWMDLVQLRTLIKRNHIKHIILNNLDILGRIGMFTGEIQICTSYIYNSLVLTCIPEKINYKHCIPRFCTVTLGGWDFSNSNAYDEIPHHAKSYMQSLLIYSNVSSITYYTSKAKITAYWRKNGEPVVISEKI